MGCFVLNWVIFGGWWGVLFLVGFLGGWWVVFVLWWVMGCVVLIGFFWAFVG